MPIARPCGRCPHRSPGHPPEAPPRCRDPVHRALPDDTWAPVRRATNPANGGLSPPARPGTNTRRNTRPTLSRARGGEWCARRRRIRLGDRGAPRARAEVRRHPLAHRARSPNGARLRALRRDARTRDRACARPERPGEPRSGREPGSGDAATRGVAPRPRALPPSARRRGRCGPIRGARRRPRLLRLDRSGSVRPRPPTPREPAPPRRGSRATVGSVASHGSAGPARRPTTVRRARERGPGGLRSIARRRGIRARAMGG